MDEDIKRSRLNKIDNFKGMNPNAYEMIVTQAKKEVFDDIEKFVAKEKGFQNIYLLKQLNIDAMKKKHLPDVKKRSK